LIDIGYFDLDRCQSKSQIPNTKSQTITKIQNAKWDCISFILASAKYPIRLSLKQQSPEKGQYDT